MPRPPYLSFDPSIESPQPDEADTIKTIVASIERTSVESFKSHARGIRQQHAKGHGFLRGELVIYDDLPRHLRQGLFAVSRAYPVIVRLSTAFGDLRSDRIRVPRGMAVKVLGVDGAKALGDDDSTNQDFLLVNHKSYFADAAAYLGAQRIFERQPGLPDFALRTAGFLSRGLVSVAKAADWKLPMLFYALADEGLNIVGETFYSEGAIRFGDYVCRLSAAPVSKAATELTGCPAHSSDDILRESVVAFFNSNPAEYELRAQLGVDLGRTPIEDASVDWPEELTPFQPLGKIVIPPQSPDSPARRAYAQDTLSFDPWRCLRDHQPLGSIMRLRKDAYRMSANLRHQANQRPRVEPRDVSEFPD
jgi:Catalase